MRNLILLFVFGFTATSIAQVETTNEKITLSSEAQAKMTLEKNEHDFTQGRKLTFDYRIREFIKRLA